MKTSWYLVVSLDLLHLFRLLTFVADKTFTTILTINDKAKIKGSKVRLQTWLRRLMSLSIKKSTHCWEIPPMSVLTKANKHNYSCSSRAHSSGAELVFFPALNSVDFSSGFHKWFVPPRVNPASLLDTALPSPPGLSCLYTAYLLFTKDVVDGPNERPFGMHKSHGRGSCFWLGC